MFFYYNDYQIYSIYLISLLLTIFIYYYKLEGGNSSTRIKFKENTFIKKENSKMTAYQIKDNHKKLIRIFNSLATAMEAKIATSNEVADIENKIRVLPECNFQPQYVLKLATALKFAETTHHYRTGNLLFDDILAGKKIYIRSYS